MSMPLILFIADQTSADPRTEKSGHPGGAELTDQAAIEACPWPIELVTARELNPDHLVDFDVHVVGNFSEATPEQTDELVRLGRHVLFEHDVRICSWRGNFPAASEGVHRSAQQCICPHVGLRKLFGSALGTIYLTHRQLAVYRANPYFEPTRALVLGSSLMNRDFFDRVDAYSDDGGQWEQRDIDVAVVYSHNEIKGYEQAVSYCEEQGVEPYVIRDLEPHGVLDVLERTKRFVYLPIGLEPAGRLLLESRFLGCEVVSNPNAGVCGESWWHLEDRQALEVIRDAPRRFWRLVDRLLRSAPEDRDNDGGGWVERAVGPSVDRALSVAQGLMMGGPFARRPTPEVRRRMEQAAVVTPPREK